MKTVLVVDDSKIMRNIVKNSFSAMNIPCQFFEAGNGAEALHVLSEQKVDIVFLDWNMPMLSGLDFLKKIRGMDEYKKLPVVMITSEAAKYNVIEAVKHGVTAYLIKPVNQAAFVKSVSSIKF